MYTSEALDRAINDAPEVMIYMMIEDCGTFIWRMNHDMAHGWIHEKDRHVVLADVGLARKDQLRLIEALPRFGLTKPLDENNKATDDYWLWYRWWNDWHKGISDVEWSEATEAIDFNMTTEQASRFRPEGHWKHGGDI